MDGKRRGRARFLNGKLMRWSLYRATTANRLPLSSSAATKASADQGSWSHNESRHNNIIVNQDQVTPQLIPTRATSVSYYYPPTTDIANKTAAAASYSAAKMDAVYGGIAVDEEIDRKAANYISSVQERFRLGYLN